MSTKWTINDMPDQTGKTVLITGGNSGLGFESAKAFAAKSAQVVITARNLDKGQRAADAICAELPGAEIDLMLLDLGSLDSVRAFAAAFNARYQRLNTLLNNAGVMAFPERRETEDGFEMHMGVNHMGHFALTGLLLDRLISTPGARVVTVTSFGHRFGEFAFDNLQSEKSYRWEAAYGRSKLANLLFGYELNRRLAADAISVVAHPGYSRTDLQRHSGFWRFMHFIAQSQQMGALPQLHAATAPDVNGCDFIGPDGFLELRGYPKKTRSNKVSYDADLARRFWAYSEEQTGVRYAFN